MDTTQLEEFAQPTDPRESVPQHRHQPALKKRGNVRRVLLWLLGLLGLAVIGCVAVVWFLLVGAAANHQRALVDEVYRPATLVALVGVGHPLSGGDPVTVRPCQGETKCIEFGVSPDVQAKPASLQAVISAMLCPTPYLKQENAASILAEYRQVRGIPVGQPMGQRLRDALAMVAASDSCGRNANSPRRGLKLQLVFESPNVGGSSTPVEVRGKR